MKLNMINDILKNKTENPFNKVVKLIVKEDNVARDVTRFFIFNYQNDVMYIWLFISFSTIFSVYSNICC